MKGSKSYLKDIGFIRVLACIAILLYHMNILKGGYLLVCTFFVLSGYLASISLLKKESISLKKYYINKLTHLYIPLVIVVFITIAVISLFSDINWFNLKPETTSVLLGYNNFWQLDANLDYFARHVSSPFMHLWYMGIILQFDLVFPLICKFLKKMGDKVHKLVPCIIISILTLSSTVYFFVSSLDKNIMFTYYNTFTRLFSLLFGVLLGFLHHYYKDKIPKVLKNRLIFYIYIVILVLLSIFIESTSKYFAIIMVLVTIISCRLIDYSVVIKDNKLSIFDKCIKFISNISYEVYLVQYPVIFIFQYININKILEIVLIIIITFIISFILKFSLNVKKEKLKTLRIIVLICILFVALYGGYKYVVAKDHSNEMKELEEKLEENSKLMEERKKMYAENLKKEQEDLENSLKNIEDAEKELGNIVSNLSVVGIGDSVMLGAVDNLQQQFTNGYFDAAISRTAWVATDIINSLSISGLLGEPVIINLGANGDCDSSCKDSMMSAIGEREVFWLNVTNDRDVNVNGTLNKLAEKYSNVHIIDWNSISKGRPEYFIADGIHLTSKGREAYTKAIYDSIYNLYLEEYNTKKEEIIKEYNEKQNLKISFIGNSLLINVYEEIESDFPFAETITNSDYNYELIKKELETKINDKTLNNKIVFAFDKSSNLNKSDYQQLIEMCKGYKIYIVSTNEDLTELSNESVVVINFYEKLNNNTNYLMPDKLHLTQEANEELGNLIKNSIQ